MFPCTRAPEPSGHSAADIQGLIEQSQGSHHSDAHSLVTDAEQLGPAARIGRPPSMRGDGAAPGGPQIRPFQRFRPGVILKR
ncbi:hypothetical protein DEV91_1611, partial [Phyllobacterium brassicacearum]